MPSTLLPPRTFWTIGQIGRHLNEPLHRVECILRSRNITPSGMAGNARVFETEQVEEIAAALRDIDARREGGAA